MAVATNPIYTMNPPTIEPEGEDARNISDWVQRELTNVSAALTNTSRIQTVPISAPPPTPRTGLMVYADGTNWNPNGTSIGSLVNWDGTAWRQIITTSGASADPQQAAQIKLTNSNAGAGVRSKFIRVDTAGALNFINSSYTQVLMSIGDNATTTISAPSGVDTLLILNATAANAALLLDSVSASHQARVDYYDQAVQKWQLGKDTDNTFFGWDSTQSHSWFRVSSGSPGSLTFPNSNMTVSSGVSGSNTPFLVSDVAPGAIVRSTVQNASSSNNSISSFLVVTGVANAFAEFAINNQTASAVVNLGWGSGIPNGLNIHNNGVSRVQINNGMQVGTPTGGDKGVGTINVSSGIFLNNASYTNPDYVLEWAYTGAIVKYADRKRAKNYQGKLSLDTLEDYIRANHRLPRIDDEPADIFDRSDIALEKIEELTLYIIELHRRIEALENGK